MDCESQDNYEAWRLYSLYEFAGVYEARAIAPLGQYRLATPVAKQLEMNAGLAWVWEWKW